MANTMVGNVLAINGGAPAVTTAAPVWPQAGEQEVEWMEEVVRSGKWSWMGEHEKAFCEDYARFIGTDYCLCLSNGTVTIQCALQAVGVEPGDEVIVPGLTWVATAQAAFDIGANVVLVDIDPETYCIDPKAIEAAITPRTKAIIPVHLYGCMSDMDAINDIAKRHNLKVVEDVAHQHGGQWRGKCAGSLGDAGSFSFQMSKVLPSGEGGAITCNDPDVYRTAFALKQVGWAPDMTPGNVYGHNYRITEMQCVLLRGGLTRLAEQNELREKNAIYLAEQLEKIGGPLRVAKRDDRVTKQVYYALTLHFDPEKAAGVTRDQYIAAVGAEGMQMMPVYPSVYHSGLLNLYDKTSPVPYRDQQNIQDYKNLKLPVVDRVVNETGLAMIHWYLLGDKDYNDQMLNAVARVNDNLGAVKEHFEQK